MKNRRFKGCVTGAVKREEGETMTFDLSGVWIGEIGDGKQYEVTLPGTLDENGIGHADVGNNTWHPDAELGNAALINTNTEPGNAELESTKPGSTEQENTGSTAAPIATRFTRKHTFEGEAVFSRELSCQVTCGKRYFLEAERARCLRLLVDGQEIPHFTEPSLSTPHVFEVTDALGKVCKGGRAENDVSAGKCKVTILSDNSYQGLPRDAILGSSAATDETQTNWNGILGYFRIRQEEPVFISEIRVYPKGDKAAVHVEISADEPYCGRLTLESEAFADGENVLTKEINIPTGMSEIVFRDLQLSPRAKRWDEGEGFLHELTAALEKYEGEAKTVAFGIRDFGDDGTGRLALNGRRIFLRSEANCAVFPETGHPPMTVEEWSNVLLRYQAYGVNCMRFHSHCPPEAAFTAADRLGMLMQPELSHWNPKDAFASEESYTYYQTELTQMSHMLANHPSFVMLTLGNELHSSELGHERMDALLRLFHEIDDTRLIANGSNVHYGELGCDALSDFNTTQKFYQKDVRGTFANMEGYLNHQYPNAKTNFDDTMQAIRKEYKKPVFSFEVGQYEILPDFDELEDFQGISEPANLKLIQKRAADRGLTDEWKRYVEATGELSCIGYREEIEAAMRTRELSGISLLGLQDFPGQGTALVGMLNSHLQPKPFAFAQPQNFRRFFREQLPLVLLEKYTYENTETLQAVVQIANFGKRELRGELRYELRGEAVTIQGIAGKLEENGCMDSAVQDFTAQGSSQEVVCPVGQLTDAGSLRIPLTDITKPARLDLKVWMDGTENCYPIWVYPKATPCLPRTDTEIYETEHFDARAKEVLKQGGIVYLTPPSTKEALPSSIRAQFTTDFWSVGTFAGQEGAMGQLIDEKHPLFRNFPTEFHTNWQWWAMAVQRAVILPGKYQAIITEMDSYAFLRPMAQLLECRCLGGRLLFSTLGLQNLQQYPECRALLQAIYCYLGSAEFKPKQEIAPEVFEELVH